MSYIVFSINVLIILWRRTYLRLYAHIEVVVTFLVVNLFGFLVIAPYPTIRFLRKLEEKLRTGLLDLPEP